MCHGKGMGVDVSWERDGVDVCHGKGMGVDVSWERGSGRVTGKGWG